MSLFADIDKSGRVDSLLSYLDRTDESMAGLKAYMVATAHRYCPGGRVLDLGCGVGHDLARLATGGLRPVGVDVSYQALLRARAAHPALIRGDGARLPFRDGAFDACRIERVLQHVDDPALVLAEAVRVVRPGGLLAVLEPDHSSFLVESHVAADGRLPGRYVSARHPAIGAEVAGLLHDSGCRIDDIVTEASCGYELGELPLDAELTTRRAVAEGLLDAAVRDAWLAEQVARTEAGTFRASWSKVLVVARSPLG